MRDTGVSKTIVCKRARAGGSMPTRALFCLVWRVRHETLAGIDWLTGGLMIAWWTITGARSRRCSHGGHPVRTAGCLHGVAAGVVGEFTSVEPLSLFMSDSNGHQIERMETLKWQISAIKLKMLEVFNLRDRLGYLGFSIFRMKRKTNFCFTGLQLQMVWLLLYPHLLRGFCCWNINTLKITCSTLEMWYPALKSGWFKLTLTL